MENTTAKVISSGSPATLDDWSMDPRSTGAPEARSLRASLEVALLTGGTDRPYALGLASALGEQEISLDFIGSNDLDLPEVHSIPNLHFRNLRGDSRPNAGFWTKVFRILAYYGRLFYYAATARPKIFHILWNNKFEMFDRTLLMLYYRLLGRKLAFTAHNVNAGKRDRKDSALNRFTLKVQYHLAHHIFVHTERMRKELHTQFGCCERKISVIPFGINNTVPTTRLTTADARSSLGLRWDDKTMLFFGHIAPYKGLDYLIVALEEVLRRDPTYRLIIAGRPTNNGAHWQQIQEAINRTNTRRRIIERIEFIPDEETEIFFKAADVLILPYTHVFQSGVLSLGYSFGLPVIAADVGSLRDDIIEGKTGYIFKPRDAADLVRMIQNYFSSPLFRQLSNRRSEIQAYANDRYSWSKVGEITRAVYQQM